MSYRRFMAIALALMMFIIPLSMSFDMSAADEDPEEPEDTTGGVEFDSTSLSIGSFNERSNGTVSVTFTNNKDVEKQITVYITKLNSDGKLDSKDVTIPAKDGDVNGSVNVSLSFRLSSPGAHYVTIHATPVEEFPNIGDEDEPDYFNSFSFKIDVSSSIWSNTSTYVVIVVAIILIVIAVYLRLRANRVPKAQGRFTAMEMERKVPKEVEYDAPAAVDVEEDAPAPVAKSSEKQEYTGKVTSAKKKPQQTGRKSNPNSRRSSKRK